MTDLSRRTALKLSAAGLALAASPLPAFAQAIDELVIAYNVNLPSWDPTVGPSAVNPTIQGIYQSVFDMFIHQNPDLSFAPGLITEWGWNEDRTKVMMTVRDGVTWHDGSPFTAEDVVWSLTRAGNEQTGNPIQFIWSTLGNFQVEGNKITADVLRFEPTIFKWMSFLTGYVLPKAYYEKVGPEGFEAAPIGTGPYMVDKFERNAFVRLKANENYWGGAPAFKTVTIKFVTDARYQLIYYPWTVNAKWWSGLSADDQKLIQQAVDDALAANRQRVIKIAEDATSQMKAKGVSIVRLSAPQEKAWQQATASVWTMTEGEIGKDLIDEFIKVRGSR